MANASKNGEIDFSKISSRDFGKTVGIKRQKKESNQI